MNRWQKLGLAASTAVLSLGIVTEKPVQAASYVFNFNGQGQGNLSFTNTPLTGLTGIGEESISLDDLSNLAQDVSFQFSYRMNFPYFDVDDYGDLPRGNEKFNFLNGQLIGMDFSTGWSFEDQGYGGSRGYQTSIAQNFWVRDDRFIEFDEQNTSSGGLVGCTGSSQDNTEICIFDDYQFNKNYEFQEEGISYQITSLYTETAFYSNGEVIVTEDPERTFNSSNFIRYDELPQITFTTLEPITPSEPIPEPLTVLGTGAAMAFGFVFKQKKDK